MVLSYLSSAQQVLTSEPQENIRKPLIAILTLNSGLANTGNLTGMAGIPVQISAGSIHDTIKYQKIFFN